MDAVLADVFQMHVSNLIGMLADYISRIVADAEEVADVSVHPHQRLIAEEFVFESEIFGGGFDEQSGFWFDGKE